MQVFQASQSGTVLFVVTGLAMNEGDPLLGIGVPAARRSGAEAPVVGKVGGVQTGDPGLGQGEAFRALADVIPSTDGLHG